MKIKKFILVLIVLLMYTSLLFAQTDTSYLYLRFPNLPPFSIIKAPDSIKFSKADLNKKQPTIMMIFSPDCEHCQHTVNEIKTSIRLFKKVQVIMASPVKYNYVNKFYEAYKIADYPNIIMGSDATDMLGTFYNVKLYPAIFLYNKKGRFIKAFDPHVSMQQIAEAL